ncbi:MAG: type II toxin-antitoxin system RelE/ParE family toxin [Candidatus Peregrinibacteria bacterium]
MKVYLTEHFKKQLKKLKKGYPHVKEDLLASLSKIDLKTAVSIGNSIYKIRIKSRDLNRGKSGGFRSYIHFYQKEGGLIPLCIYAKSKIESISEKTLQYHIDMTNLEMLVWIRKNS